MRLSIDQEEARSKVQWRLHDFAYAVVVLALIFANLAPAARSGSQRDWAAATLLFARRGFLISPVLLICLVIGLTPTSLESERGAVILVVKMAVVMMLAMALVIQAP